MNKII